MNWIRLVYATIVMSHDTSFKSHAEYTYIFVWWYQR